jgi:(p)ppGpp synthase/HD superfamily hydrolase
MSNIFDAHSFAVTAHAGQIDKGGQPYIRHLERVANAAVARAGHARALDRLPIDPMSVMQAAILHDVLEDTPRTVADLRAAGFGAEIIEMVTILTKPPERTAYSERITRVIDSGNLSAILIKMSDNENNLSPDRTLPTGVCLKERYTTGFARLTEAARALGYSGH